MSISAGSDIVSGPQGGRRTRKAHDSYDGEDVTDSGRA